MTLVLKRGFTILSIFLALCVTKSSMNRVFARSDVIGSRVSYGLHHHQTYRRAGNRYSGAASFRGIALVSSGEITESKPDAFQPTMDRGFRRSFIAGRMMRSIDDRFLIIPPSCTSSRPLRC